MIFWGFQFKKLIKKNNKFFILTWLKSPKMAINTFGCWVCNLAECMTCSGLQKGECKQPTWRCANSLGRYGWSPKAHSLISMSLWSTSNRTPDTPSDSLLSPSVYPSYFLTLSYIPHGDGDMFYKDITKLSLSQLTFHFHCTSLSACTG